MFPDTANAGLPLDRQPKAITGVSMGRDPLMGFVISALLTNTKTFDRRLVA
jgi:hypothetical protein